jgi:hypothetical protein
MDLRKEIQVALNSCQPNKNRVDKIEAIAKKYAEYYQALQLQQTGVSGRSEQLCGNLDENYNCKNMCLTRCVDGNKFYK